MKNRREHKKAGGQGPGAAERRLSTSGPHDELPSGREPGMDRDSEAPGPRPPAPGPRFDDPRLAINRVYTRRGDAGDTSLAGGQRISKDAARIEAYGAVDELNAFVGVARASLEMLAASNPALARLAAILLRVQHELFNLGSILATLPEDVHPRQPRITEAEIAQLEKEMDEMNAELVALALVRAAGRLPARRRVAYLPHRLPPRRAPLRYAGAHGRRSAGDGQIPQPPGRRAVRVEPMGEPRRWRERNFVGTEPVRLRAEWWIIKC